MDKAKFLDSFIHGYLVCALWSSTDEEGKPLDDEHDLSDISPESLTEANETCSDFVSANWQDLCQYSALYNPAPGYDAGECAGHDFWLTRNGHGVGFWDRGLGELGDRLSKAAKVYGEAYLYVGDDGKIYS